MVTNLIRTSILVFSLFFLAQPAVAAESSRFEISGWIPYWRAASGTQEALLHIDTFQELNPFVYTVKSDGTIFDAGNVGTEPWKSFFKKVDKENVRLVPTIMWSDGVNIHRILSDKRLREKHVRNIVNLVNDKNFDGIDIDYEAKLADTNPYFSLFLKELQRSLGKRKWLMCTIEPRTPLVDRNVSANSVPRYANDYEEINKHCDRVRIMAYDQASVDKKLTFSTDLPYIPVADVRWVEKVMREAMETIDKDKLMLGIPTYGYEYEVIPLSHGYRYNHLWAFNQRYATGLAAELGVLPQRNIAGELSFIYRPEASSTAPVATVYGTYGRAASFLSFAGASFHILWWSDAEAIRQKVELARRLGVRGVSIFKIDGGADQGIWNFLPSYSTK